MNEAVSMKVDTAAFQSTLRRYLAVTSKALPEALNQKMFFIARGASRGTPKVERGQIERELSVTGYAQKLYTRGPKKGQVNKRGMLGRVQTASPFIYRIINSRLGRVGKKGLHGSAMKAAATKLLAKRFRSIGTLKAGWLGAIRALGRVVGESSQVDGASSQVKGRSRATLAREGWSPQVSIEYLTNSFAKGHQAYIDARVQSSLAESFAAEARSMEDYMIKKLQGKIDAVK